MNPTKRVPGSSPNILPTPQPGIEKEEADTLINMQLFVGEGNVEVKGCADPTDATPTQAEGTTKRRHIITHDFINANLVPGINAVKKTPLQRRPNKGSRTKSLSKQTVNSGGDTSVISPQTKTRKPRQTKASKIQAGIGIETSGTPLSPQVANFGVEGVIPTYSGIDIKSYQRVVADLGLGKEETPNASSGIDVNTSLGPININQTQNSLGNESLFQAENPGPHEDGDNDDVDMNLPLPNTQAQYRSGDYWMDPSLGPALKTITCGLPNENSQDQTRGGQQPPFDPSYTQVDRCFKLPVFDPSSDSGSLEKPHGLGAQTQSPPGFILPPGFSLPPGYSNLGSHHPGLDGRKDYRSPNH